MYVEGTLTLHQVTTQEFVRLIMTLHNLNTPYTVAYKGMCATRKGYIFSYIDDWHAVFVPDGPITERREFFSVSASTDLAVTAYFHQVRPESGVFDALRITFVATNDQFERLRGSLVEGGTLPRE